MPLTGLTRRRRLAIALALLVASAALLIGADHALAQAAGPFGVGRPDGPGGAPAAGGFFAWIAAEQSRFYRALSAAIRAAKTDNAALVSLAGLSFAYGVFHAAGPGHGKAVISSYLVATGEGFRRGVALSTLAALAQAVTAITAVGLVAVVLGATSMAMGVAAWWLEAASYVAIFGLGVALLWRKGRGLSRALQGGSAHVHGPSCAHDHGIDPRLVEGKPDWRRAGAAVIAIGLRPCTGALVVLAFALAQGIAWAGVAATFAMAAGTALTVALIAALAVGAKGVALRIAAARPGAGAIVLAALEALAAAVVLAFGAIMLAGMLFTGAASPG
jgi:ABC-type nickel/cobalt efflux system permease component RcnA